MKERNPRGGAATAAFLRTFAIQGSWNYRTLVGGGLAYAMFPLLKWVHAGDPVALRESLERHASSFNGHPYLCAMAVAALARLELERRDPGEIARFRTALSGPLGALGDRAVWAGWRPLCLLSAIAGHAVGLSAAGAVVLFLVLYNAGHLWLRVWAYREGWASGLEVGRALSRSVVSRAAGPLIGVNVVLLGAAAPYLAVTLPGADAMAAAAALGGVAAGGALVAYLLPAWGGVTSVLLLLAAAVAWLA